VVLHAAPEAGAGHSDARALGLAGLLAVPARDSRAVIDLVVGLRPDLVLLDVALPGIDTAELLPLLRALGGPPTLVVGPLPASADRVGLLRCGADSCLPAPYDEDELVAQVQAVLRRHGDPSGPGGPELVGGPFHLDLVGHVARLHGREIALTALEFGLLTCLVRHPDVALSRERLLAEVWGYTFGSTDTVTVHMRRLRTKVEPCPSQPRWIQTVWGVGYRFAPVGAPQRSPAFCP
jgi:DNA-binding response OmpR family regulator